MRGRSRPVLARDWAARFARWGAVTDSFGFLDASMLDEIPPFLGAPRLPAVVVCPGGPRMAPQLVGSSSRRRAGWRLSSVRKGRTDWVPVRGAASRGGLPPIESMSHRRRHRGGDRRGRRWHRCLADPVTVPRLRVTPFATRRRASWASGRLESGSLPRSDGAAEIC